MATTRRSFLTRTIAETAAQPIAAAAVTAALPPLAVIVYNRLAYGPRPNDIAAFNSRPGDDIAKLTAWVDEQLNPASIVDAECDARLAAARIKIRYDADMNNKYPAVNEARPLQLLNSNTADLWQRVSNGAWPERMRGFEEVRVATWLRARHSERQLYELLVDFWHNHFNVNAGAEAMIASMLPVYDRAVIRTHALGNFRVFLEEVAKSTVMMYYLDNYNNVASGGEGGNENYARELFELHTFSTDNYFKFYDDRTQIPKLPDGVTPAGYIDGDVYEAASCLTGWTINKTNGNFVFDPNTHYNGTKEVLGRIIRPSDVDVKGNPQREAQIVYDMLANHPGVARNIIGKLCRRLISDDISAMGDLIDEAVAVWIAQKDAPDQLRQVVRVILLSAEFRATWGKKVKRPFEAVMSYLRATNAELPIDVASLPKSNTNPTPDPNKGGFWDGLFWTYGPTGHRLFEWPTPTGHPDLATYWTSTNSTLRRWNLPYLLTQEWSGNVKMPDITDWNPDAETRTVTQIVDAWIERLFGYAIPDASRQAIITFFAAGSSPIERPKPTAKAPDWNNNDGLKQRYISMIQLLVATPGYHNR